MGIYNTIFEYKDLPDRKAAATALEKEVALNKGKITTPGETIMKVLKLTNGSGVDALFNTFTRYVQNNGYFFRGTGQSGAKLLDGDGLEFECAGFVNAFKLLCGAPAPYGLGLPAILATTNTTFKGTGRKGFVSPHPAMILGRESNISPGHNLMFWDNHKVIEINSRFYDPSYGLIYERAENMARYNVRNETAIGSGTHSGQYLYEMVEEGKFFRGSFPRYFGPFNTSAEATA